MYIFMHMPPELYFTFFSNVQFSVQCCIKGINISNTCFTRCAGIFRVYYRQCYVSVFDLKSYFEPLDSSILKLFLYSLGKLIMNNSF